VREFILVLLVWGTAVTAFAQAAADPALLAEIEKIRAIDNHTHVQKVVAPGEQDTEYDALPCEPLQPSGTPLMSRPDNPMLIAAWKALYSYPHTDTSPAHLNELMAAKQRVRREQGDNFPNWVLDKLGIEVMFANRIHKERLLGPICKTQICRGYHEHWISMSPSSWCQPWNVKSNEARSRSSSRQPTYAL
jgi:hypothetical protein